MYKKTINQQKNIFMLFFLSIFSFSLKKPIILIPGHGGGGAWVTITKPELYPECPPLNDYQFWPYNATFAEKYPECMGYLIRAVYNETTKKITHPDGIDFRSEEWGHMDSLYNYVPLVEYLVEKKGYEKGKNLWGIGYDWVLYYPGIPELFDKLKQFIEEVHLNSGQKVILMGHSMGTHVVRLLLTNRTTKEWVQEHIDGIELLAPAFYGCFVSFSMTVYGKFGAIPINPIAAKSARQMPSLHVLWDNYVVFDGHQVFQNVPGREDGIKPNEVKDYLVSQNRFDKEAQEIFKYVEPSLQEAPIEPPVRSYLLYNSGISTPVAMDASANYSFINISGDAICHSGGPEYVCKHWNNVECFDWKKDDWLYSHSQMMYREGTFEKIYKFIGNDDSNDSNDSYDYKWIIIGCVLGGVAIIAIVVVVLVIITKRQNKNNGFTNADRLLN